MATSPKIDKFSDTQDERKVIQAKLRVETWKPLKYEIKRLVDALCDLDDDKTKSVDIITEHTMRIKTATPPDPWAIAIWYPKPIHHLLSVHPLQRTEIPLDVLEVLVSSGFDVNAYFNTDGKDANEDLCQEKVCIHDHEERITCLHLAVKNYHYNAARWLVQHGADCNQESHGE